MRNARTHPTQRARAQAAFRFVRDEVLFGFTGAFDDAGLDETLRRKRGHCNPQAALFVALLRELDIPAWQHFVSISSDVLRGVFPRRGAPPPVITHSYVELELEGRRVRLDGYILDRRFVRQARRKLQREGRHLGYGAHIDGCNDWDGEHDCMAQLVSEDMVLKDHGLFEDPAAFYASDANTQRLGFFTKLLFRWFAVPMANETLSRIRSAEQDAGR